jgi:uncharacterized protein YktB (UPF0637 family)
MNVDGAKAEMLEIVTKLREQLAAAGDAAARELRVREARHELARIRKKYNRKIDTRASRWFSIHQISGVQRKLGEIVAWAEKEINSCAHPATPLQDTQPPELF